MLNHMVGTLLLQRGPRLSLSALYQCLSAIYHANFLSLCYIGFAKAKRLACFEVHAKNLKSLLHLFGFLYCKK